MASHLSSPQSLASTLRPAILKLARHIRRESKGVSAIDAQLVAIIAQRPGIGVSELAGAERMSSPSMSAHVKRLEAAGWVAREPGEDRRRARLTLTLAGEELIATVRRSRTGWLAIRLARLEPAERAAIAAALDPLAKLLEHEA